ncbi:carbon monoxide dehydrogenase subunit G [Ramlibacter tataouinensis]|uniref:SRPBCC family protein n=1 Tax=Ramlibacter tataouinensis TaxID=94132 RepID=UPI0022F3F55B|nr:carbon monoxide dehydrogenase subunit G [Ramlibacter tataouinensis]WBY03004.1 carbon monoxide dehydrogenase subunit G [Ramlibacter tataouinensis]
MKMNGEKTLPLSQQVVWEALNDPEVLKGCIPGCETVVQTADGYEVVLVASIGPVKARFKGQIVLKDVQAPDRYTLVFSGQGGVAGHGKGEASVALSSPAVDSTLIQYTAQASVGGKLAQIGSRLVDMAAQKMAEDFFAAFVQQLQQRHAPVAPAPAQPAGSGRGGLLESLLAWFSRVLRGRPAVGRQDR